MIPIGTGRCAAVKATFFKFTGTFKLSNTEKGTIVPLAVKQAPNLNLNEDRRKAPALVPRIMPL